MFRLLRANFRSDSEACFAAVCSFNAGFDVSVNSHSEQESIFPTGMISFMLIQIGLLRESPVALDANEWFFTAMNFHMTFQVAKTIK